MAYGDRPYEDDYYGPAEEELHPEGPSGEDLRRLDRAMQRCPHCGSEIYDDAERCPACDEWVVDKGKMPTMWTVTGVVVIVVFVLAWVL